MWILYQVVLALALLVSGPFLLVRRGRHYLPTLRHRLGRFAETSVRNPLWIHAVSVGEVGVAATLAQRLPPGLELLVTTITPTGQSRARAHFEGRGIVTYLPFDLGFAARRFFARFQPGALVLVEGDYWPLILHHARRRQLPVVVVNGRMSDGTFRRLRRLRPLLGLLFGAVDRFGVQTAEDRQKLLELGIRPERVTTTGNLKYETPAPEPKPELEAKLVELAGGRPILVAGSTMAGEEEQVLAAFAELGGGDRALLILAPRHPERWGPVSELVERSEFRLARRSAGLSAAPPDVVLLDSLGELAALYRIGLSAFIGGTLVPTGGHNPLEAACWGVPVVVGPSMENFHDMARQFDRAEAWHRVANARELATIWGTWLDEPGAARDLGERGLRLIEENRGAVDRTLQLLEPVLADLGALG
jgi:3-deoxy-D-manno-octulosonic-acid transferase